MVPIVNHYLHFPVRGRKQKIGVEEFVGFPSLFTFPRKGTETVGTAGLILLGVMHIIIYISP